MQLKAEISQRIPIALIVTIVMVGYFVSAANLGFLATTLVLHMFRPSFVAFTCSQTRSSSLSSSERPTELHPILRRGE
jgi:hypothetical protein